MLYQFTKYVDIIADLEHLIGTLIDYNKIFNILQVYRKLVDKLMSKIRNELVVNFHVVKIYQLDTQTNELNNLTDNILSHLIRIKNENVQCDSYINSYLEYMTNYLK